MIKQVNQQGFFWFRVLILCFFLIFGGIEKKSIEEKKIVKMKTKNGSIQHYDVNVPKIRKEQCKEKNTLKKYVNLN